MIDLASNRAVFQTRDRDGNADESTRRSVADNRDRTCGNRLAPAAVESRLGVELGTVDVRPVATHPPSRNCGRPTARHAIAIR